MRRVSACLAVVATICATGTAAGQSTGSADFDLGRV